MSPSSLDNRTALILSCNNYPKTKSYSRVHRTVRLQIYGTPHFFSVASAFVAGILTGIVISGRNMLCTIAAPLSRDAMPATNVIEYRVTPPRIIVDMCERTPECSLIDDWNSLSL